MVTTAWSLSQCHKCHQDSVKDSAVSTGLSPSHDISQLKQLTRNIIDAAAGEIVLCFVTDEIVLLNVPEDWSAAGAGLVLWSQCCHCCSDHY